MQIIPLKNDATKNLSPSAQFLSSLPLVVILSKPIVQTNFPESRKYRQTQRGLMGCRFYAQEHVSSSIVHQHARHAPKLDQFARMQYFKNSHSVIRDLKALGLHALFRKAFAHSATLIHLLLRTSYRVTSAL